VAEVISENVKKLVIARLETMPENMKLSLGGSGDYNKYELIDQVKDETAFGKKVVEMHLMYLRSFKKQ
jgi:hypothetical protein